MMRCVYEYRGVKERENALLPDLVYFYVFLSVYVNNVPDMRLGELGQCVRDCNDGGSKLFYMEQTDFHEGSVLYFRNCLHVKYFRVQCAG